jgi:hypothetical protein
VARRASEYVEVRNVLSRNLKPNYFDEGGATFSASKKID